MINVYKNQLSRQTGSRNLTGPKTLPTIWYTWEAFLDPSDSYFLFADFVDFYTHLTGDKDSICQACGKNELVFAGPNTTEHFCQWLFSGENEGATVIAHNFKGYDSLFLFLYVVDPV
jgi:hypothetical protein